MAKEKKERGPRGILGRLQKMQEDLMRAQAALAEETVEATAGGGVVKVIMSGTQECKGVEVKPQLVEDGEIEMLQDMLQLAINQAIRESQALAAERLGPLAGGLGLQGGGE
jgi:DNA-binding YbaB/EbfC family protein